MLDKLVDEPADFRVAPEVDPELAENEYLGRSLGIGGDLSVVCTIADGVLQDVRISRSFETPGIGTKVTSQLPDAFVVANGLAVDAVAGATASSRALVEAVASCLERADIVVEKPEWAM